jgi:hypothetical protein
MWKQNGFKNLSTEDLVSAKAMGIDNDYVADIRKAGYNDITLEQLISFKAQTLQVIILISLNSQCMEKGKCTKSRRYQFL